MKIELQPVHRTLPGCYVVFADGEWHGDLELQFDGTWEADTSMGFAAPSSGHVDIRAAIAYCLHRPVAADDQIVMTEKFYDGPKECC